MLSLLFKYPNRGVVRSRVYLIIRMRSTSSRTPPLIDNKMAELQSSIEQAIVQALSADANHLCLEKAVPRHTWPYAHAESGESPTISLRRFSHYNLSIDLARIT